MHFPEYFTNKIIRCFGDRGARWLEELPEILERCVNKWSLTDCSISNVLSFNLVCFAKSPNFGEVALKIGVPHADLYTEMRALTLYEGRNICKCYDQDRELGAILLERVTPGNDLNLLQDSSQQIRVAAEIISKLPVRVSEEEELPKYSDWVDNAFTRARNENKVGQRLLSLIDEAERLFVEIDTSDRPKVLIHGDLHHENILLDANDGWKAIDPKGVIGVACIESARFINCHMELVDQTRKLETLDEMVTVFSNEFGESKRAIAISVFVLWVLSVCWTLEEANPNPEQIKENLTGCEFVLEYINVLEFGNRNEAR